jgi:phosphopantetheinyl transferase
MPIYKHLKINTQTALWVWRINETEIDLEQQIQLTPDCNSRLKSLRSTNQRKAFLAIRCLLKTLEVPLTDLYYETNGKPYLKSGTYISISHAQNYAAVALSKTEVGLDIEQHRSKVKRVAHKFVNPKDQLPTNGIPDLITLWCSKEAIYKALSIPGVSFRSDIVVKIDSDTKWSASYKDQAFDCYASHWKDYSCVLTQKKTI